MVTPYLLDPQLQIRMTSLFWKVFFGRLSFCLCVVCTHYVLCAVYVSTYLVQYVAASCNFFWVLALVVHTATITKGESVVHKYVLCLHSSQGKI